VVDQLYKCGVRYIFLSLKESLGRSLQKDLQVDFSKLGDVYFELWKHYRSLGVDINLTGTDIHSVSLFPCSVPIPNYSVSPDGEISACTVSFNDDSQNRDIFKIGEIDNGNILIDSIAIKKVREFNILNISGCATCFAKWHCRGGCIYAKNGEWFNSLALERCEMVRNVVARKLLFTICG
jgi:radical SAM protein with 4Fe4S-binding SPASM domain